MNRRVTIGIIAAGILPLAGLGVATASASQSSSVTANAGVATPSPGTTPQATRPAYPTNAQGLSYGSELDATNPDQAPDLIAAIATNGRQGYVRKVDLYPELPINPSAAVKAQAGQGARAIPVYSRDGVTVVGEFVIGPPNPKAP